VALIYVLSCGLILLVLPACILQGFDLASMYADLRVMEGKLKLLLAEMAANQGAAAAETEAKPQLHATLAAAISG
jgi:hypothetical protein